MLEKKSAVCTLSYTAKLYIPLLILVVQNASKLVLDSVIPNMLLMKKLQNLFTFLVIIELLRVLKF